jgi:hypothetical protein
MSDTSENSPREMSFNELMRHNQQISAQTQELLRRANRIIADSFYPLVSRRINEQMAADQTDSDIEQGQ